MQETKHSRKPGSASNALLCDVMPGDRVKVYEYRRFVNDIETPVDDLMLPATVVARYGKTVDYGNGPVQYPDLVDVQFDHDPEFVSHGHFTQGIEVIEVA